MDTFWMLLVLASQITLIYYGILFITGMKLGCNKLLMSVGLVTSLLVLLLGFIAPSDLSANDVLIFHMVLIFGMLIALIIPSVFLFFGKKT